MSEDTSWGLPPKEAADKMEEGHERQWGSLLEERIALAREREAEELAAYDKAHQESTLHKILTSPLKLIAGVFFLVFGVLAIALRPFRAVGRYLWRYRLVRAIAKPFIFIAYAVWKVKTVFVILFKLKGVATFASMFISVAAYALIWGWVFAAGFVALLFIHEMGHWVVLKRQGVKTSPVVFIPFLGAVIGMKEMPKDAYKEAQMALGGPILGSAAAGACLIAAHLVHSPMLQALAYTGFLLNLFNLLPVVPLDGGRAVAAVHPALWLAGLSGLVGLLVWWHSWAFLALFCVIGLPELSRRLGQWRSRKQVKAHSDYYALSAAKRITVGVVYVGLALALVLGMRSTYVKRHIHQGQAQVTFSASPFRASDGSNCYFSQSPAQINAANAFYQRVGGDGKGIHYSSNITTTRGVSKTGVYASYKGQSVKVESLNCQQAPLPPKLAKEEKAAEHDVHQQGMITPACYSWWSPAKRRYVSGENPPQGAEPPKKLKLAVAGKGAKEKLVAYVSGHGLRQRLDVAQSCKA